MDRRRWIRIISLLAALAVAGLIFWFSAQDANKSSRTSSRLVSWLMATLPSLRALPPEEAAAMAKKLTPIVRKLAHFSEFALLGLNLGVFFSLLRRGGKLQFALLKAWGIASLYGVTDELHQLFVKGRGAGVVDALIDSGGALAGAALAILAAVAVQRLRQGAGKLELETEGAKVHADPGD